MAAPDPLVRIISSVTFTDSEISRILSATAQEASHIVSVAGPNSLRGGMASMANLNAKAWGNVHDAVKVGVGDAVWGATEMGAMFDERMFAKAGFSSVHWRNSLIAQAGEGVQSLLSRKENGITLSQKVYQNAALSSGKIDDIINSSLALGLGPKDIAARVKGFIDPSVPGGASFAAMRLGRSEVTGAFHTTSINKYKDTPWVEVVQWNISGSHPKPDECDDYGEGVHFQGGDAGQFRPSEVPVLPHPNCLCNITPVTASIDKFTKDFNDGKFDDYINGEMGCYRGA